MYIVIPPQTQILFLWNSGIPGFTSVYFENFSSRILRLRIPAVGDTLQSCSRRKESSGRQCSSQCSQGSLGGRPGGHWDVLTWDQSSRPGTEELWSNLLPYLLAGWGIRHLRRTSGVNYIDSCKCFKLPNACVSGISLELKNLGLRCKWRKSCQSERFLIFDYRIRQGQKKVNWCVYLLHQSEKITNTFLKLCRGRFWKWFLANRNQWTGITKHGSHKILL